jgi:hypothetical protein
MAFEGIECESPPNPRLHYLCVVTRNPTAPYIKRTG